MKITGTFLDEISHDIPHQNWGRKEWEADFDHMQSIGIDTVILIRCGYQKFITYPSKYLMSSQDCFEPPVDLVQLFLELAAARGMRLLFGLYDSGHYWKTGDMSIELETNKAVIDEVFERYGHFQSFGGWYLSTEISRRTKGAIETFAAMGKRCKEVSGGLITLISPWIDGVKAVDAQSSQVLRNKSISLKEHEEEWDEIFSGIRDVVDIVAFQDGHVNLEELTSFFQLNKALADKHGLVSWTNAESFDRDMPIKFLPIKFEKLLYKLRAAEQAGLKKAVTFEFSHFMSPQSAYIQAHHLFNRYKEYFTF